MYGVGWGRPVQGFDWPSQHYQCHLFQPWRGKVLLPSQFLFGLRARKGWLLRPALFVKEQKVGGYSGDKRWASTTGIPRAFLQASGVGKPKVLVDWLLPYRAQVWLGERKHSSRNTPVTPVPYQPEEIGGRKAGNLSGAEPLDPRKALLTRTSLTPHRLLLCPDLCCRLPSSRRQMLVAVVLRLGRDQNHQERLVEAHC